LLAAFVGLLKTAETARRPMQDGRRGRMLFALHDGKDFSTTSGAD